MTDGDHSPRRRSWLRAIRPDRRGGLVPLGRVQPRCERVALCAIAKNEGPYLAEWVRYHLGLGFDDIFIYDNESTDGGFAALPKARRVHVRRWPDQPGAAPQLPAYDHFFRKDARGYDWVGFLDIDEFLNVKTAENVHEFLSLFAGMDGVAISWRIFGSAGREAYEPGDVIDRFPLAAPQDFGPHVQAKTFFRPSKVSAIAIHSPYFVEGARFVDSLGRPLPLTGPNVFMPAIDLQVAQINHYFTKSKAEFLLKRQRGRGDLAADDPAKYRTEQEFTLYDRNEEEDRSILRLRR